jgi:hypothetical protein
MVLKLAAKVRPTAHTKKRKQAFFMRFLHNCPLQPACVGHSFEGIGGTAKWPTKGLHFADPNQVPHRLSYTFCLVGFFNRRKLKWIRLYVPSWRMR